MKVSILLILVLVAACSSRKLVKTYKVMDASSQDIPEWLVDKKEWVEDNEEDYKKNKYYDFSTELKNSRVVACEIAKLRASSEVASEITQSIKHEVGVSSEGEGSDLTSALDEYFDETLVKNVHTSVVGAQVIEKYWEKRELSTELGAKINATGYSCSTLVKVPKENIKAAYDIAFKKLKAKVGGSQTLKQRILKAQQSLSKKL